MDPLAPNALPTKDSQIESLQRLIAEQQATIRDRERERDELQRKLDVAINSLKNVSMVGRRERRTVKTEHDADAWGHIIRFCEEAGIKSSILRDGLAAPAREGEGGTE